MKKTSKLFGAVICSAALAVGCAMPAFAVTSNNGVNVYDQTDAAAPPTTPTAGTNIADGSTASTPVEIATNIEQISVEVPTKMTFVAKSVGGDMLMPQAYRITNWSNVPIYVKDIKAQYDSGKENAWVLTSTAGDAAAGVEADSTTTRAKVKVDLSASGKNYTLDTTGWTALKAADGGLTIGKATNTSTPTPLPIALTGTSSVVKDAKAANAAPEQAFNIVYTVSASNAAIS